MNRSAPTALAHTWTFFRQWLKNPLGMAAISPSSRQLARQMMSELPRGARRVVELGGGTGVFTRALLDSGIAPADLLVLECVPSSLAAEITAAVAIPTIGIGAGPSCDGQILVLHDLLGMNSGHRRPRFVKDFLAEGGSIRGAMQAFAEAVRNGTFPDAEHSYA